MRYLLFLLLLTTLMYAKSKDACYSVQLSSFVLKKNSTYDFEKQDYPRECRLIAFSKINAVRCGCYEKYKDAAARQKDLVYFYPAATLVTTYKYRLKDLIAQEKKRANRKKKSRVEVQEIVVLKPKQEVAESQKIAESQEVTVAPKNQSSSYLENMTFQGHLDLTTQTYLRLPQGKHHNNITAGAVLEVGYAKDDFSFHSKFKAQEDYYDLQSKKEHNNRSYLRLDELYGQFDFDDDQIVVGKNIRFWGALEVRNITDGFNPDELRDDPFDSDKLGVWNVSFSHYTENGEITAIAKLHEQSREMSAFPYVYYYFPEQVNGLPYVYKENLKTEEGKGRPSIYLKYAASTDTEYALDYAVIFENGYDSQRYYTAGVNANFSEIDTEENAYLVNKLSTYDTLVVGSTLLKLEAVYADVISDKEISDYYHIGLGVEHTLTQFYGEADLGLLVEYYKYGVFDKSKRSDLALFELFQNDLFLGARYTFNDGNDASIVGGAILDFDYDEQVYYVEYETRLLDTLKINFDYRYINPSSNYLTAFRLMGKHERLSLKVGYYF